MKQNLYTQFLDILRNDSSRMMEVFRAGRYFYASGEGTLPVDGVSEYINNVCAREKLQEVLYVMRRRDLNGKEKLESVKSMINTKGLLKLAEILLDIHAENDENVINELIDSELEGLFTDIPPYDVEVTDDYRIFIVGRTRREVKFRSFNARVLYLYMLLHSGQTISKRKGFDSFRRNNKEILSLALNFLRIGRGKYDMSIYHLENLLSESFIDMERSGSRLHRTGLDEFLSQSRPIANSSVLRTVDDADVATWYIIEKDKLNETYSLSLPKEHIYLPQNLAKFIKKV